VASRIEELRKQQAGFQKQADQLKGRDLPEGLQHDLKTVEADLQAQQQLLEVKKREADTINARYDDDKKRYSALSRQR